MKVFCSLLCALLLLIALSPTASAAEPEVLPAPEAPLTEGTDSTDAEAEDAPEEEPLPTPGYLPNIPVAPADKDELSRLLRDNSVDYAVDLAAYYLEEMRQAAISGSVTHVSLPSRRSGSVTAG
jgi:hypothetical protein